MKTHHLSLSLIVIGLTSLSRAGTVTTTADSGSGSLRDLLAAAVDGEVIDFAPPLNGQTITLTSGSLAISGREVTIDASTLPSGITLSGNNSSRILAITASLTATADVTLENLHLVNGRETAANGGGILAFQSRLVLYNCTIRDCFSNGDGGGLWGNGITGAISRSTIAGNQAGNFGGGAFLIAPGPISITSSEISGNKAAAGGGISNLASSPAITNCSIQGNSGSGIRNDTGSSPILRNTIVWGNDDASGTTAARQLTNSSDSKPDVAYCLVEGASGSGSFNDGGAVIWGTGNLNGTLAANDPRFVSAASAGDAPVSTADLRLMSGSPAFDAGLNSANSDPLDLAGKPRIQGAAIDLGAFEGPYVSFSGLHPGLDAGGDENSNGVPNFVEYAMGFDPNDPNSHPLFPVIASEGGATFLTFSERDNAFDVDIVWQTSTDLSAWSPMIQNTHYQISSSTASPGGRREIKLAVSGPGSKRFYRQGFSQK